MKESGQNIGSLMSIVSARAEQADAAFAASMMANGAVVDSSGHVHGVERLLVADASIMPEIPSANTNLPTIMIAERIVTALAHR